MSSKPAEIQRRSISDALGLPCAIMSLVGGVVGLTMTLVFWWNALPKWIERLGDEAGIFSAIIGITLACMAISSQRKSARVIGFLAILINLAIIAFVVDNFF